MKNQRGIKALHILHGFGIGGAETWMLEVARHIQRHPELGLRVDFLLTGAEKLALDDEIISTGARIFYVRYSLGKAFAFRRQFLKVLREGQYDAVHDHQDFISGWHFLLGIGALPRSGSLICITRTISFTTTYITRADGSFLEQEGGSY
jgi:hypothetical protein